jgi:dTDP-4-amino-4,6-dideoxygalactose transaminase
MDGLGDRESSWGFRVGAYSAAQAGLGHSLLGRLDAINAARSQRAARLLEALEGIPGLRFPQVVDGAEPIYVRLPLLVTGEERRNRLFDELRAAGIGVGKMYRQPLPVIFPDLDRDGEPYPGARAIAAQLLTLPTHHYVTDADIVRIATTARQLDR